MRMEENAKAKEELLASVGDLEHIKVFRNQLLVAIFVRPEKTRAGIILPGMTRDEDKWQGKVGLIVKVGSSAFDDPDGKWFKGLAAKVGDWIVFRPSDGWQLSVNEIPCRLIDDVNVRAIIPTPDLVW